MKEPLGGESVSSPNIIADIDIVNRARDFSNQYLRPIARDLDIDNRFPEELLGMMAEEGFFGSHYPVEYGGGGHDSVTGYMVAKELAKASAGVALTFHVHWMAVDVLLKYGTTSQKQKYLMNLLQGKKVAAYIISEAHAGSDVGSIRAMAVSVKDGWVLNGTKYFCTNGGLADVYLVVLKTDMQAGPKGISMFMVEKGTPGFEIGKVQKKMGCRSSVTTGLSFRDCVIPHENIVGKVNGGFQIAMHGLTGGRLGMASMGLGIAEIAMEEAVQYANRRIAYGNPLSKLYSIQEMIADMYIKIEATKLVVFDTARKRDRGEDYSLNSSVAKLLAADTAFYVCNKAMQIFGGHGYMTHNPVERYIRDARLMDIGVGASEVLKMAIGTTVLKEPSNRVSNPRKKAICKGNGGC
jgi:alkylation response protein AidB-like acyl-CoA dehydrogenase